MRKEAAHPSRLFFDYKSSHKSRGLEDGTQIGNPHQLLVHATAVGASIGFSFIGSAILLKLTDA
jgi:hypothetical protein